MFTTPSGHPHPQSSLFHAHATAAAPPSSTWGGTRLSRPITAPYLAAHRLAHTPFKPTPEREHQPSKPGQGGGGGTIIVPPPPGERTHQSTQTPQANTGSSANTQPQPPASKHAHSKPQQVRPQANTRNVPTPTRVGTPSVSAGTRVLAEATGTNEAQTTNAGTQDNAHNKRANNQVCVRCAPAPAREDSAREGRSQ